MSGQTHKISVLSALEKAHRKRAEGVEIAIRYSENPPGEASVTKLLQETIFRVVSPKYSANTELRAPQDLLRENLLHLSGNYRPGARWPNWLGANEISPPKESSGVVLNTYINMLQAAIAEQGIALAGNPLVDPYLSDESLKKLDGFLQLERDHFFPINTTGGRDDAGCFCDWRLKQTQESTAPV